jgi:pSer/pThr/pTyr-binding forkhead associated (FHA) protein
VRDRYMIFDLNSTGGTFVNGIQITQQELTPGDLISLAGVPLIYGQEQPYLVEETQDLGDLNPSDGAEQGE